MRDMEIDVQSYTHILPEAIAAAISSVIGYYAGIRHKNAKAQYTEVQAVEKVAALWRQLAADLEKKINKLQIEIEVLMEENAELKKEIRELNVFLNKTKNFNENR